MRVAALLAVALLGARVSAEAQAVKPTGDGRISVNADSVPLERLLAEFANLVDLKIQLDPAVSGRLVTVTVAPAPVAHGLWQVLLAADVDAVLSAGEADRPMRTIIRDRKTIDAQRSATETPEVEIVRPQAMVEAAAPADEREREDSEVENEDADGNAVVQAEAEPNAMPPEAHSAERLIQLLAPTGGPKVSPAGGLVSLPFPGPDGLPYTVPNTPPPPGIARLPFPDGTGGQLEIVVPPSPPGQFMLPFPGPDGRPYTILVPPPRPPAPAATMPGGPTSRRPGSR